MLFFREPKALEMGGNYPHRVAFVFRHSLM